MGRHYVLAAPFFNFSKTYFFSSFADWLIEPSAI
jgi:hypothetical protein